MFRTVALLGFLATLNSYFPQKNRITLIPSFFAAWLVTELAPWWLFWEVIGVAGFAAAGEVESNQGLVLAALTAVGLLGQIVLARKTPDQIAEGMGELAPGEDTPAFPGIHVWFPVLMRRRAGVKVTRDIVFAEPGGKRLKLDVWAPEGIQPGANRPGILQIHGGGWVLGDKREQAVPLLGQLASNGWVGVNANYRLSPKATFPEHLIDLKCAIAWYRQHATEYGADPDFLCVTGGSAGGHLTALVALTANDPEYQPGFEDVDTTMRAAVPIYGVYDFTNRAGRWHKQTVDMFFAKIILKKKFSEEPEAFAKASPIDRVHPDAPPTLVIHGTKDTLAPYSDAVDFVEALRSVSRQPVLFVTLKGAEHAFEVFPSYRTGRTVEAIERYLTSVHTAYATGRSAPGRLDDPTTAAD